MLSRRAFIGGLASTPLTACTCDDNKTQTAHPPLAPYLRRVDAHLHIGRGGLPRALELMQREGIAAGVNLSGGALGHGLEEQLAQARPARIELATFTSPHWPDCAKEGFGAQFATRLREAVALGARGLKIHKTLGLKVRGPDEALLAVDTPQLDTLFETAGELRLPVWIHTGDPLAFWSPPDDTNERRDELLAHPDWGLFGKAVPTFDQLYAQLERRVARHPKTQFVSVHFGNCAEQPQRVAASLRQHANLYIDTAARIPELGRHPPDAIRAFFTEFQDRILFGSDLGVGPTPSPLFLGRFFDATRRYFETADSGFEHPTSIQGGWHISGLGLPSSVLEKLYVTNATRLLQLRS
jgi:predicted TIM-barrel fold metal-dependent hydrolase